MKVTSDKQKAIIAELKNSPKNENGNFQIRAGEPGSRFHKACETLIKNNPEFFKFVYTTRKHTIHGYDIVLWNIEMKGE
jgi:hypothetical protein